MSFDGFLNQTCMIDRPSANGVDRYNQNQYDVTRVGSDVRCRLIEKSVRVMDAKTSEYSWIKVKMLLVPDGTDIQVKDEVIVDAVKYSVKDPSKRKRSNADHHVSVIVEALNA